jgi:hypothetical protein
MGYIKNVVQTGAEFADKYQMPEYVAKARASHKIIDAASEKIEHFYCEKGSPLVQLVDEFTAAKINMALDVANNKVEHVQKLKSDVKGKVQEKTTEAIEIAKKTKESAYEKSFKAKQESIAKFNTFKIEASKKVDETKTILHKRVIYAGEEACRLEEKLEKKLKEKAATNEYADKVLSVVMTAKKQVKIYGEALVKKSLALPLTLQERMEKANAYTMQKVKVGTKALQAKKSEFVSYVSKSYAKVTPDNALYAVKTVFGDKAAVQAQGMLQSIKKADLKKKVNDKMKSVYTYSTFQVGHLAEKAEKMEGQYVGTGLVFKLRAKFTGK